MAGSAEAKGIEIATVAAITSATDNTKSMRLNALPPYVTRPPPKTGSLMSMPYELIGYLENREEGFAKVMVEGTYRIEEQLASIHELPIRGVLGNSAGIKGPGLLGPDPLCGYFKFKFF